MAESKKSSKKIIDVSHPGKTAPAGNSKSVIVSNRPIMKDPMVVDQDESPETLPEAPLTPRKSGEAVIQPLSEEEVKTSPKLNKTSDSKDEKDKQDSKSDGKKTIAELAVEADAKAEEQTSDKATEKTESEPEPEVQTETEASEKTIEPLSPVDDESKSAPQSGPAADPEPASEDKDSIPDERDKNADQSASRSVTEAEEAEAAAKAKRDNELQKLVTSKKYFLPINAVEKRRSKRVILFGVALSLILILAWVDIAIDAGLINVGVKPLTHFFSN